MKLQITSILGKVKTIELNISEEEFFKGKKAWEDGALIQRAFPTLTADERELLLTGLSPQEWDVMFREDDELKK